MGSVGGRGRLRGGILRRAVATGALVLAAVAMLAAASAAEATPGYKSVGTFGYGTVGQLPTQLAIDESSGDVFVVGNGSVQIFDSGGAGASLIGSLGQGELSVSPFGIAIDQANADVYVSDPGLEEIVLFEPAPGDPPTYRRDNSYVSPKGGSGTKQIGSFASPLAIDPITGDLLVADRGNQRVSRFDPAGEFVSSFTGADTAGGPFTNLRDLTVAPGGDIYVVDLNGSIGGFGEVNGTSRTEEFSAAGASLGRIGAGIADDGVSVAFDSVRGLLDVAGQRGAPEVGRGVPRLYVFKGGVHTDTVPYPAETGPAQSPDLAFDGNLNRLYGLTGWSFFGNRGDKPAVDVFEPAVVPTPAIDPPDQVTSKSAHFSGTVDPGGTPTGYRFEYSRDGGANWESTPTGEAGEGEGAVAVEASVADLVPNNDYLVRLTAENGEVSRSTEPLGFSTPVAPPAVVTGGAIEVDGASAVLTGSVDPFGLQTTYHFEYGPTTAYGSRAPANFEGAAGRGYAPHPVEQTIAGLVAGTTYHYRLVAQSAAGLAYGVDRTFIAEAPAPRAYELVSATNKFGSEPSNLWVHASRDGESVTFQTAAAIPGQSGSGPYLPRFHASRTPDGWGVIGLEPPQVENELVFLYFYDVLAVSPDGSKAVVVSTRALAPGGTDGDSQIYVEDLATQTYTTIVSNPGLELFKLASKAQPNGPALVFGGSLDFSKIYLTSFTTAEGVEYLPGTSPYSLYEWTRDQGLKLVAEEVGEKAVAGSRPDSNIVSEDGSQVFYENDQTPTGEIWVHENNESFRVSEPNESLRPEFIGASGDGRYVVTGDRDHTLYRYDLVTRTAIKLPGDAPAGTALLVSRDGSYVYYVISEEGENRLSVWHDGALDTIAKVRTSRLAHVRASPSGRYFVFGSNENLTGFDSRGFVEIYRYDAVTQNLECVSCRTDGMSPGGDAGIGDEIAEFDNHIPRSVLDDGEVFFDTPDPLLPADVNSSRDVYSYGDSGLRLISAGTGTGESHFADASEDGRDVFFTTYDRLVAADTDNLNDVYDARRGGGIPSQNMPLPQPGCQGEGCRAAPPSSPPRPGLASESSGHTTKAHRHKNAHRHKKVCRKHSRGKKAKTSCKRRGKRQHGRAGR